jgi:hypothetical protein
LHFIDSVSNAIEESRILNYKVWPLLSAPLLWPSYIPPTYKFEIDTMKQWLTMHTAWMDDNIARIHYSLPPVSIDENEISKTDQDISIYPVPFTDYIQIKLNSREEIESVEIVDISGRTIIRNKVFVGNEGICEITGLDKLLSGTYLILIKESKGNLINRMILKK